MARFIELRFADQVYSPHTTAETRVPRLRYADAPFEAVFEHGMCKITGKVRTVWTSVANVTNAIPGTEAPVERKGGGK